MPRLFTSRMLCVMTLAAACVTGPLASQGVEKSLLVTVLDEKGLPIKDLAASEFLVREDNVNRAVVRVAPATDPLFVTLLIDTTQPSAGSQSTTQDLRTSLTNFVKSVQTASPSTQISVMEFGGAATTTVKFTTKTDDLEKTLKRLYPSQRTGGVMLEALVEASKELSKKASPRRAIVVVSMGTPETSTVQPRTVADAVQKSGASFWAVTIANMANASSFQAGNNASDNAMSPLREVMFENLPGLTGGLRYSGISATGLNGMLDKVAAALASQYLVTYASPDAGPAKVVQATATRGAKALTGVWVR